MQTHCYLHHALLITGQQANAASLDKAAMLSQYGSTKEAKAELIDVIFSKAALLSESRGSLPFRKFSL